MIELQKQAHRHVYDNHLFGVRWMGHYILKSADDLMTYHEVIWNKAPDLIIEVGTGDGGSGLFLATCLDLIGDRLPVGRVVSIDIAARTGLPKHPRLEHWVGSSLDESILRNLRDLVPKYKHVMVILDGNHTEAHVRQELEIYSQWVSKEQYLVAEDTNLNGNPAFDKYGPGPMEAVRDFLRTHRDWEPDHVRERFMTFFPDGWLIRKAQVKR